MGARDRTPVLCQSSKLSQLLCHLCIVSGTTYFHHGAPLQAQSEGNNCLCPEMPTTMREIVFFSLGKLVTSHMCCGDVKLAKAGMSP